MKNEIDMLYGPLLMKIIMFTLPLAASSILQQLFNSVDVAVVGVLVARPILTLIDTPPDVLDMAVTYLRIFFLSLFTDSPAVVAFGKTRMHIALAFQWIAAFYEISGSVMRGMGKSMEPTLITIFGTCLLRIAWIYAIMPGWRGFDHLVMVYPVSWTITAILMLALFFWRSRKLLRDSTKPA